VLKGKIVILLDVMYLQCDVIYIGTDVSGVYRSNINIYHCHNFRSNSGATSFSDIENRSIIK
jgi:predicted RNase H-related nuclease YkuK (DUF458 family)